MSGQEETAPRQIGPYEVEGRLGRGGMGIVYRGHDRRLGRTVALKALPAGNAEDPEPRARLEREARVLAALADRNIATILGLEEHEGRTWLVLEHVEGESLGRRLERGPVPLAETLRIAVQVAGGLAAAHAGSIVHRDLTPGNVMLTPDGGVKIIDFGLARATSTRLDRGGPVTDARVVVGTPGYMSPEQIRGARPDPRTDAWAFGCLLYECLVGRPAMDGEDDDARLQRSLHGEVDWSALPSETPEELVALIRRCLSRDLSRRPADLGEILPELRGWLSGSSDAGRPTRPLSATSGASPVELSSFVGRRRELARLEDLLVEARLVTLVGAGGCGKTRLALEAARRAERSDGTTVQVVDLAPLADPDQVAPRLAAALGLPEDPALSAEELLLRSFGEREHLLVLDNCEHLLASVARLAETLLTSCPALRLLATSREGLAIPGERIFALQPLELPPRGSEESDRLFESEAVQLFLERARAVRPDFAPSRAERAALVRTCRRLDGLPLALELAAARLRVLSLAQLDERLDDRFRVLSGGRRTALPRQQTLRAALDWSHELLDEDERVLLRRLAVFAASFSLEAIEATCADERLPAESILELLARLVDKSLVLVVTDEEQSRYRLLETVRQYATERLVESGETADLCDRHRNHLVALAERLDGDLKGPRRARVLERLGRERDDIDAVLDAVPQEGDLEAALDALRLAVALRTFWGWTGHWTEGRRRLETTLARAGLRAPARLRAQALVGIGRLAVSLADFEAARERLSEALELWRDLEDSAGVAAALNGLSIVAREQGRLAEAEGLIDEGLELARASGDAWSVAVALNARGNISQVRGELVAARPYYEESLALFRQQGGRMAITAALLNLGTTDWVAGELSAAREHLKEGLDLSRRMGNRSFLATALESLGTVERTCCEFEAAEAAYKESLAIREELVDRPGLVNIRDHLAAAALGAGRSSEARSWLREALALRERGDGKGGAAPSLLGLARAELLDGSVTEARALFDEAARAGLASPAPDGPHAAPVEVRLLLAEGKAGPARAPALSFLAEAERLQSRPELHRALALSAELALGRGLHATAAELVGAAAAFGLAMGASESPPDRPEWDRLLAGLKAAMTEVEFHAATERGGALSLADGLELARSVGRRP